VINSKFIKRGVTLY